MFCVQQLLVKFFVIRKLVPFLSLLFTSSTVLLIFACPTIVNAEWEKVATGSGSVLCMADGVDKIWLGMQNGRVYSIDKQTKAITRLTSLPYVFHETSISQLFYDLVHHKLWILRNDDLVSVCNDTCISYNRDSIGMQINPSMNSLFLERTGRLWLSSYMNGIRCFDNNRWINPFEKDSLCPMNVVLGYASAIIDKSDGDMWFSIGGYGNFGYNLFRFSNNKWESFLTDPIVSMLNGAANSIVLFCKPNSSDPFARLRIALFKDSVIYKRDISISSAMSSPNTKTLDSNYNTYLIDYDGLIKITSEGTISNIPVYVGIERHKDFSAVLCDSSNCLWAICQDSLNYVLIRNTDLNAIAQVQKRSSSIVKSVDYKRKLDLLGRTVEKKNGRRNHHQRLLIKGKNL